MKTHIITNSFEQTERLGFDMAKKIKGGGIVALYGDLGSGKTTFVQGLAKGLGVTKRIISPSFIIMRSYVIPDLIRNPEIDSRLRGNDRDGGSFYHSDLYRIKNEKDIEGLGLLDLINDNQNIVAIEWPEKIEKVLPEKRINIYFEYLEEDLRKITIVD